MHLVLKNACLTTESTRKSNLLPVTGVKHGVLDVIVTSASSQWNGLLGLEEGRYCINFT